MELVNRNEAERNFGIIQSSGHKLDRNHGIRRNHIYTGIVKKGNRREISKILNTLLRKKQQVELNKKKLSEKDSRLLEFVQNTLFSELAMSLNTTSEAIHEKVISLLSENEC